MTSKKSITLTAVRAAYEKINKKPCRRKWYTKANTRCCPQYALGVANKARVAWDYAEKRYGLYYSKGFRWGYDNFPLKERDTAKMTPVQRANMKRGWRDGRRIAAALGFKVREFKRAA